MDKVFNVCLDLFDIAAPEVCDIAKYCNTLLNESNTPSNITIKTIPEMVKYNFLNGMTNITLNLWFGILHAQYTTDSPSFAYVSFFSTSEFDRIEFIRSMKSIFNAKQIFVHDICRTTVEESRHIEEGLQEVIDSN